MTPRRLARASRPHRRAVGVSAVFALSSGALLCLSSAAAAVEDDDALRCDDATAQPSLRVASASADEEFTSAFRTFGDTGGGWEDLGGWAASDGTYSVELGDGSVAWLMNDTFMGPLENGLIQDDARFLHGTILPTDDDGHPVDTVTGGTREAPTSIVDPPDAVNGNPWYWNEDGLVDDGALRVFQAKTAVNDGEPPFNFAWVGSDIVTYDSDFRVTDITPTFGHPGGVHWGVEVVTCGEDTYVYGQKDGSGYVARVPRDALLDQETWRFHAAGDWVEDEDAATPIIANVGAVFSVSLIDGTFVLASTETFGPFGGHTIDAAVSGAAQGPFVDRRAVYTAPEGREGMLAPYNVAGHPWLSEDGTLLLSYNVNAMSHDDVLADPNNYRPRFVSLTLAPTDDGGVDPTPDPTPTPTPDPTPSPDPTPTPDPTPSPDPAPTPTPDATPDPGPPGTGGNDPADAAPDPAAGAGGGSRPGALPTTGADTGALVGAALLSAVTIAAGTALRRTLAPHR
ncbi:hypothetical protein [Georgenia faecalis]|uniref:DUF4185 domain-containing protein n=1 Tax=Georgenia faecalis TaxID=2483799 RepID=A0ABV9DDA8_9MICO|nr:hypothetical protein [Georgenia faecalis]